MPSLYPILLSIAIIGSLGVVYETYFAESVEDWFSELVERRREARRSRERKIRVEQGFEGNGGNENEGRKSWERERELDELVRREGLAGGKGPFEEAENEEERLMRRSWSGFAAESGSAGGGLLPGGGGGDQVRRRTNSRLGSRGGSDDQLDFGTLLKPLPNPGSVGTAPPQTHVLFTYSSPLPTPSALPPLPLPPFPPTTTTTISSPLTNISTSSSPSSSSASSSSSSASHSNNSMGSIHFPSSSSSALSFASLSLASTANSPLPSPSLLDRPPSTLVSTSWAHIPPSSSLHPDDGDDARSQTLTLRSGSTGLLVSGSAREGSISNSTRSWAAGSVEEGWSARSSLDLGGGGSDVESVWSEGGFESVSAGGSLMSSSFGERGEEEEEEEGWSDVGGSGSAVGGR